MHVQYIHPAQVMLGISFKIYFSPIVTIDSTVNSCMHGAHNVMKDVIFQCLQNLISGEFSHLILTWLHRTDTLTTLIVNFCVVGTLFFFSFKVMRVSPVTDIVDGKSSLFMVVDKTWQRTPRPQNKVQLVRLIDT